MLQLKYILVFVVYFISSAYASSYDYIICGLNNRCFTGGFGVYCCGYNNSYCCYYQIYHAWWFWLIWTLLVLFICACSYNIRRRRLIRLREHAIRTNRGLQCVVATTNTAQYPIGASPYYTNSPPAYTTYGATQPSFNVQPVPSSNVAPPSYSSVVQQYPGKVLQQ